jgi:hypothetical protein
MTEHTQHVNCTNNSMTSVHQRYYDRHDPPSRRRIHLFLMSTVILVGGLKIATCFPTTSKNLPFPALSLHPSCPIRTLTVRTTTALSMATRDGKQRRPKKQSDTSSTSSSHSPQTQSTTSSSSSSSSNTPPARVSNAINIPIRHQIRYGRLNKAFKQQQEQLQHSCGTGGGSSGSFKSSPPSPSSKMVRTRYRRKWNEEELVAAAQIRKNKGGQDPNWQVNWNITKAAPLVIVDGYNIIYQWSRLKKHMIKGDVRLFSTMKEP